MKAPSKKRRLGLFRGEEGVKIEKKKTRKLELPLRRTQNQKSSTESRSTAQFKGK